MMDYKRGLRLLKERLAEDTLTDFYVHEIRLLDNLSHEDRFGSTETIRAERAAVLDQLNQLAHRCLGSSFNDLCQEEDPPEPPPSPAPERLPNPFQKTGRIKNPTEFVGREVFLDELFADLSRGSNRSLIGAAGLGKSSILQMVCVQGPARLGWPAEVFISMDMQLIHREDEFFEALCYNMGLTETLRGYKLARMLEGKRYILCLDEIEKMRKEHFSGNERSELRGLADGADALLTLLIASREPLEDIFPDAPGETSPLAGICTPMEIPPLTLTEAHRFLEHHLHNTGITFTNADVESLFAQSGGHPGPLKQEAARLFEVYRGRAQ